MLQSRQNNIQVLVRIKPEGNSITVDEVDSTLLTVSNRQFHYDHVIPPSASQQDVFTHIGQPLINNALQGYNGCVFAYGQTGSGKTHTLIGNNDGILPQSLQYILACTIDDPNATIKGSFLEIYNEHIYDLLSATPMTLQVREDPKKGTYVDNLTAIDFSNYEQAIGLLKKGNNNRHIAATKMNSESSRSHAVFLIQYSTKIKQEKCDVHLYSKVYFVDLAGSERQKTALTEGMRLKEAQAINKSLTQLGLVIYAIVEKENGNEKIHIPFRDSKLTTLLKDSLGGNSKTFMIAAVNPLHQEETISTLRFAERVKQIKVKAQVNKEYTGEEITKLQLQIQQLKDEINRKNRELEDVKPGDALQSQLKIQFEEIQILLKTINQCATQLEFEQVEERLQEFTEKQSFIIQVLKSLNIKFDEEPHYESSTADIELINKLKIQILQQEDVVYKLQKKKKELEQSIQDKQSAHQIILSSIQKGYEDQLKMKDYLQNQLREDMEQIEVAKLALQYQFDKQGEELQEMKDKFAQIQLEQFQEAQKSSIIQEEKQQNMQGLQQELDQQLLLNEQLRNQLETLHNQFQLNNEAFKIETEKYSQLFDQQNFQIKGLQEQIQNLENENGFLKSNDDYKRQYDLISFQFQNLKCEFQKLDSEYKTLETERQYHLQIIEQNEYQIQEFGFREDALEQENNVYKKTIIELQSQLNQSVEFVDQVKRSLKIENTDNIIRDLTMKLNGMNRNEQKLRSEFSQCRSENQQLTSKLQIKDSEIQELQQELYEIKQALKKVDVKQQVEDCEKHQQIRILEEKIKNLMAENDKIAKSKISIMAEYTNLERAKRETENFLALIEKKLQEHIAKIFKNNNNKAMTHQQQVLYLNTTQMIKSKFVTIESLIEIILLESTDRLAKSCSTIRNSIDGQRQ